MQLKLQYTAAPAALARSVWRLAASGLHRPPLDFERDRTVLLFFEDCERDRLFHGERHLQRWLKRAYRSVRGGRSTNGFAMAFRELKRALELEGCRVVVNDFPLARANPSYPIGIAGYPHVLRDWPLPNPAVLGPGFFDHPGEAPELMRDPRFKRYLVHSEWMRALFGGRYGQRCVTWYAGIDTELWPDFSGAAKDLDVLVYEKFIWQRQRKRKLMLEPLLDVLRRRRLRFHVIAYGSYGLAEYRALLERSRSMLFLVEHETQGLACGEAMSCNVPVLAWDQGRWLDPKRLRYGTPEVPASSVPYFSAECGERFSSLENFEAALDRFWERLPRYRPRDFVIRHLSLRGSAQRYLEHYLG